MPTPNLLSSVCLHVLAWVGGAYRPVFYLNMAIKLFHFHSNSICNFANILTCEKNKLWNENLCCWHC